MRKRARVDQNHAEIVAALRRLGYRVLSLAPLGSGVPDLLVHRAGKLELVEVKAPKGKLRPAQAQFQQEGWPVRVIRDIQELT